MIGSTVLPLLIKYKYLILFPLTCIEGPIIALVVGFLIYLGYISFLPAFLILILGDFIPDSIFYYIGRFGNQTRIIEKYDTRSKFISRNLSTLDNFWKNHPIKMMLFSKLAYGLSIPLLITAGFSRMLYFKFAKYAVIITIFNYGTIVAIGFALGGSYTNASGYIKYFEILLAVVVIIIGIGYFLLQRYARSKIINLKS